MSRPVALLLGCSSGFGAATARALAGAGHDIVGVHLDRRSTMPAVQQLARDVRALGAEMHLFNENAADDAKRASMLDAIAQVVDPGQITVLLHSLAFGSLRPFIPPEGEPGTTRKQLEMTLDVMAHSLVYWTRDVVDRALMGPGGRVFALSSSGSTEVFQAYGAVSAAKSALESHVRQLALELAPRRITVNALMPGVTLTPALSKIPGSEVIIEKARSKNPHGRLTQPEDVAQAIVALAVPGTHWITGNVITVDGGELVCA